MSAAQAQGFTWGGGGSATVTSDYNLGTNWANPPAGAPPLAAGQSAIFDSTGSASVVVTAGPIAPNSWLFNAAAQSYTISGAAVNFSVAGASGGIIVNANSGQSISISNNIGESVAGVQVQLVGNSALTLYGNNTYSGGTTISGFGTLSAVSSNAVGTGTVTLEDGQFQATAPNLTFSNNFRINNTAAGSSINTVAFDVTISGNITDGSGGSGQLTVDSFGGGAVILTGTNTYTGGTTICACSTLQLGDGGTTGSIVGNVVNGGTLAFNRSDAAGTPYVFAGVISDESGGSGQVTQIGTGTVVLSGANTYSGGTVISNGIVRVTNSDPGTSSSVGTGTVTLDGGTFQAGAYNLEFSNSFAVNTTGGTVDTNSNTLTLSGTVQDGNGATGVLTKSGAGTLILTGNNSYSGGTNVTAGTLGITNGGALGSGDLTLAEGTRFQLDGTFTLTNHITVAGDPIFDVTTGNIATVAGTISDASLPAPLGVVEKIGAGTLVLSGTNTYSGGTVISAGTLQVVNASSVGSGAVTMDGGTFQADGAGDLTFSNNFKVNTTGGAVDNNGIVLTLSGTISNGNGSTGVLQLTDSSGGFGTTVLSGVNTYTGGTNVVGTALQVTNNSSVGTGTVTLENGLFQAAGLSDLTFTNNFKINATPSGSAIDANGISLTIAGNITDGSGGAGKLTVLDSLFGGGVVVLTGTNTYTGGTTICDCATLQLGDATHTGSIVGAVTNHGYFDIVNANTAGITSINNDGFFGPATTTFFNATSAGSIAITNRNGGETDFGIAFGTDTATAGNATIVNRTGGVTVFNAMTTAGNATITNRSGGTTYFYDLSHAGSASITNRFGGQTVFGTAFGTDAPSAGTAVIVNRFGGNTEFNALATASSATITNRFGGSTDFYDFSTAGNATITTNNGGVTYFHDNADGGTAQFITAGTGFVDFSGSLGPNGDGRIAAGSIAGSGFYYIGAGNTLVVGGNNLSTEVSGVIADYNPCGCFPGIGNLEKAGTGTLILSGINTYTGTTTVNGGVLQVDGSIVSSSLVTVNANAALTGAGTVGHTVIASGGIFLPGNGTPGSSMTVSGNLAFQSGALYLVQLNSVTSTFAIVSGTAALNGTVGASFAVGSTVLPQYTILTAAGGRSGAFTGVDTLGVPSGFVATLSYDPTHAYLNFVLDYAARSNLNVNQQNVGNALANFFNANGGIPVAFAGFSPTGLSQVSGATATGSQQATFDAMNIFLGLLTDPFVAGRGDGGTAGGGPTAFAGEGEGASAYAAKKPNAARDAFAKFPTKAEAARNDTFDQRWSVWGAAYGGGSTTDGNAALGSNTATARAFGLVAGADYRISPYTLAGFALAGGGTSFGVNGFGSGRSDLFQAGAFMRHTIGPAYVTAALAYGWQDVTTDRTVTVAGIDRLRAEFNANAWSGRVEGGYRFVTPWMGITPYAAGQFTTYSLPAYAEQVLSGANTFALNYAANDVTASRSELGVRTDKSFAMQNGVFTLRGRAAWAHNFNIDRSITPVFQTLPGASFVVNGAAQAHDAALVTGSAEMKWLNGFSLAATFEGEFSSVTKSYAGKGVARYAW